ncbi:MAG: PsbP-related protein [Bdellovibrio sp.]
MGSAAALLLTSSLVFAASPAPAPAEVIAGAPVSSLKTYQDDKENFKILYPTKWKVQTPDPKKESGSRMLVSFGKADSTILVSILKGKAQDNQTAADFLNQLDQSRKAQNLIPEKLRQLSKNVSEKAKVSEAAVGYYEIAGKSSVLQRVLCLKKKDGQIFVITGTFQKAREMDEDPLIESILSSFESTEKK